MRTFIQDLRYGARMLLKRPGFSLIAVITLALGIGANLTILSFVDTMFLRPLPVRDPYQLVNTEVGLAYPLYLYFRDHNNVSEAATPFLYLPYWQNNLSPQIDSTIVARVAGDPEAMLSVLRREIAKLDPNVPIESITMKQQVNSTFKHVLLSSSVLIASGLIALFLSMIGLYGALAFAVSQRTREIGIRMALGANTADVLKLVVGKGLRLVFAGVGTGLVAAVAATRLMKSLLYGVSTTDPITFGLIAAVLLVVAVLACWLPARRAARVDPLVALRYE